MLSLRSKLVIWHTAIVAIVLTAFAYAIYSYVTYGLLHIVDTSLLQWAERQVNSVGNTSEPSNQSATPVIVPQFAQIIEQDGRVADQVTDPEGHSLPVDLQQLRSVAQQGGRSFDTIEIARGEPVRVITYVVFDERKQVDYYVRIGQSLRELQTAQKRFLWLFSWTMPLALALTVVGGYWLAQRAIAPVDRLTRAAKEISEKNLKARVETQRTNDEIGRLADTFNEMISRLEQAFERQRQFTADASHELRTPLAVMRNDIEIALRRERTADEFRAVLNSTLEENVRLSSLVEDLLTLARSDSGEVEIEHQPVELDKLVRELCEYAAPMAEAKGLKLNADTVPVTVSGDARRLKQLLLNLLDNAIKYTDKGSIEVSLASNPGTAVLNVRDTGRGIEPDDLPRVFDRFFRHSHASTDEAGGTGLGLSICKWIVQAHGGQISVTSTRGVGTDFQIEIPS